MPDGPIPKVRSLAFILLRYSFCFLPLPETTTRGVLICGVSLLETSSPLNFAECKLKWTKSGVITTLLSSLSLSSKRAETPICTSSSLPDRSNSVPFWLIFILRDFSICFKFLLNSPHNKISLSGGILEKLS